MKEKGFGDKLKNAIQDALIELRSRVNPFDFKEEYAENTFFQLIVLEANKIFQGKGLKETQKAVKKYLRKKSKRKYFLGVLEQQLEVMESVRKKTNKQIENLKKNIKTISETS